MKLVKLSLAAVVAAGSFSFANAVALDEAIQNVDLSGYLRYRYDSETIKKGKVKEHDTQWHKLRGHLKFTADIADNFKATAVARYDSKDHSYGADSNADTKSNFVVREGYLTYNNFDTTFNFGRMEVPSIWTDGLVGDGLLVLNNSVEGLTLGAYVFDTFNKYEGDLIGDSVAGNLLSEDISKRAKELEGQGKSEKEAESIATKEYIGVVNNLLYNHNLYGIAAIGSFAPVDFQLWVSYLNKVGAFYALDVAANLGDKDDFAYKIHAQYAGNSLKKDIKDLGFANGNFYGVEAGFDAFGADFTLGYVGYGKKDKYTVNTLHDKGQLINAGEIAMYGYTGDLGKKDFVFGTLGYTYADVRFGVDLVYGTDKHVDGKAKAFEVTPRLSYKYSDKLSFSSFYAYAKVKEDGDVKTTEKQIRLEAKYTF